MLLKFAKMAHVALRGPHVIFSSPEPKAQVSYCRRFLSVVRRPSCVNFLHFYLLLKNPWADVNQTWWGSSLGGRNPKLFIWSMWPPGGPRGRAPKGKKWVNFKNLLLQTQKQYSHDLLYVDTFINGEYKLFMSRPRMAPLGP